MQFFEVGDILFFREYSFTDSGEIRPHFGLVLVPETATQYQGSVLCAVITSQPTRNWFLLLNPQKYECFSRDSYACFNRKDLVAKMGLDERTQPRAQLDVPDKEAAYKILKSSLYALNDFASDPFMRGVIIFEWKKALGKI